jgi:hypothetical protein
MLKFSTTNAYVNHTVMARQHHTSNEPPRHSTSLFPPWSSSSVHHPNQVLRLDLGSFFLFAHDYVIGYNTQPTYSNTIYLKWCQKTVGLVSPCKPYVLTPGTANVPWCGWVGCLNFLLLTPTSITQSWHGNTTRRMSPPAIRLPFSRRGAPRLSITPIKSCDWTLVLSSSSPMTM